MGQLTFSCLFAAQCINIDYLITGSCLNILRSAAQTDSKVASRILKLIKPVGRRYPSTDAAATSFSSEKQSSLQCGGDQPTQTASS
jgi:hypothetical protein